jgi:large conductance mechanosensitive channel
MLKEFRDFIMRGNVLDLAVAIVLGVAFGTVIASFVNDILMPPIGLLLGGVDFTNLFITLSGERYPTLEAAKAAGAATINYGVFINTVINFIIIAFVIFLIVRQVNRMRREAPTMKDCPYCFSKVPLRATRCPNCTSALQPA